MRQFFKNNSAKQTRFLSIGLALTFFLSVLMSSCGKDRVSPGNLSKEKNTKTFADDPKPPKEPGSGN
ncbi:hypothetical protein EGI22_04175 [Lacihabitans sp. LS3-19]|uniref:hypothetical protein n=1 Tax=Lacihabitans sp. LS3-19 TaxID=2487335 RepID=UPI0020CD4308|nr:hypothetical protein [Lacihabitans sp. LS3-19]MCP9767094.1 hypothetical protein [Lacihabitans sp. LS3-19]